MSERPNGRPHRRTLAGEVPILDWTAAALDHYSKLFESQHLQTTVVEVQNSSVYWERRWNGPRFVKYPKR